MYNLDRGIRFRTKHVNCIVYNYAVEKQGHGNDSQEALMEITIDGLTLKMLKE